MRSFQSRKALVATAAALAAITALSACAGRPKPRLQYEERPVELLYQTGYQRLQANRWDDAVDYFQEVERQHPYSDWSRRAILMQIYAHYRDSQYQDAIAAADRFIQLYPGSPSAAYAFYMKATCNFEQITDVGRDQGYSALALEGLKDEQGKVVVGGIFAAVPYCIDLIGGPYMETDPAVSKTFRPKSALRPPAN